MLLIGRCEGVDTAQGLYERGFSNAARADDRNEFAHIKDGLLAKCRRVEEFHCCDKPASIQLLDGDGLGQ